MRWTCLPLFAFHPHLLPPAFFVLPPRFLTRALFSRVLCFRKRPRLNAAFRSELPPSDHQPVV
jgi:hypothetical protein